MADEFVGSASYYEEGEKPFRGGRRRQGYEERKARMRLEGARMLAKHGVGRVALCDVAVASGIARGSAYYYTTVGKSCCGRLSTSTSRWCTSGLVTRMTSISTTSRWRG